MSDYLFQLEYNGDVKKIVDDELSSHNLALRTFTQGTNVNACLTACIRGKSWFVYLYEFPCNCSALVLGGVQALFSADKAAFNSILDFALNVCKKLEYAALFITTTDLDFVKYLTSNGFEVVIDSLYNLHSEKDNYFLIYKIKYEEKTEISENDDESEEDE